MNSHINKDEMLSMLTAISNLNKKEKEQMLKENEIDEIIQYKEKIKLKDMLDQSNEEKYESFDSNICTFDPMRRSQNNKQDELNESIKYIEEKSTHYGKENYSYKNSTEKLHTNSDIKETENEEFIYIVKNFKENITKVYKKVKTFSDDPENYKEFNYLDNFLNFFKITNDKISEIFQKTNEEIINLNKKQNKYNFEYKLSKTNSSVDNIKERLERENSILHFNSTNKESNMKYRDSYSSNKLSKSFTNTRNSSKLPKENSCSPDKSSFNRSFLKKAEDNLDSIIQYYKDKLKRRETQIVKLQNSNKFYEQILISSKTLIEDIFKKNKLLKEKLVKYKIINEKAKLNINNIKY